MQSKGHEHNSLLLLISSSSMPHSSGFTCMRCKGASDSQSTKAQNKAILFPPMLANTCVTDYFHKLGIKLSG